MQQYSTSQIAKIASIHPNTVRFYEEVGLLPPIPRKENGYRIYNDSHLEQLQLIRMAFQSEIISGSLRKITIDIIQLAAYGNLDEAIQKTDYYKNQIHRQKQNAEEAIDIIQSIINREHLLFNSDNAKFTRKEAAAKLSVTIDVIRDWERNGLIDVPRDAKGYRVYGGREIERLKIIRTLRDAHYSMMAILRMLSQMNDTANPDLKAIIDTPSPSEDIITVTDQFISSLIAADKNSDNLLKHLVKMKSHV